MGAQLTQEEVLRRAYEVHGDRWVYDRFEYKHSLSKVTMGCKIHGYFEQTPAKHIHQKQGCPKCGDILREIHKRERILHARFDNLTQPDEYKIIPISGGNITKVSNEDFDALKNIVWSYSGNGYAHNHKYGYMHKLILPVKNGHFVDHVDRDKLNNRRENLREVTKQESTFNTGPYGKTSKYKGVSWNKEIRKWVLQIIVDGKNVCREYFDSEIEAAKVYDKKIIKYHGDKAYLNFPNNDVR